LQNNHLFVRSYGQLKPKKFTIIETHDFYEALKMQTGDTIDFEHIAKIVKTKTVEQCRQFYRSLERSKKM